MTMAQDDSNSSWNLSFDDDFDTSSDSLPEPSSIPMIAGLRIPSNTSDEGYRSASSTSATQAKKASPAAQASSSNQYASKISSSTPSKQKQRSMQSVGLGQGPSAKQSNRLGNVSNSSEKNSRVQTPLSRHRQVNSMVYSSSPSPKWQGAPIDPSITPSRSISPHNSPLMSSFARARDRQESISAGTLSGLLVRFLRSRTISTLSFRLALLVSMLLLTSLVLTSSPQHASSLHSYGKVPVGLGDLDNLAGMVGGKGVRQREYTTTGSHEEQDDELDVMENEGSNAERMKREERRAAHARIAKSFQQLDDGQKEASMLEGEEETSEGQFEDREDMEEQLFETQDDDLHLQTTQPEDDYVALDETTFVEMSMSTEGEEASVESELADYTTEETGLEASDVSEEELGSEEASEAVTEQSEKLGLSRKITEAEENTANADVLVNVAARRRPQTNKSAGRAAILAQVEASRQLALLEYQKLQDERLPALDSQVDAREEEDMQVEVDEKEVIRPGEQGTLSDSYAVDTLATEGDDDGLFQEGNLSAPGEDEDASEDSLEQEAASRLDKKAAARDYFNALKDPQTTPSYESDSPLGAGSEEHPQVPMDKEVLLEQVETVQERRIEPKMRLVKPILGMQEEANGFEDNLALLNSRKAKKIGAVGRLSGKRRTDSS